MRILFVTQVIDRKDSTLGFFTEWVEEFDKHIDIHSVICLRKGSDVPVGVPVFSLGKETIQQNIGASSRRLSYAVRYLRYLWSHHSEYDAVFVHMNEEYVLLGGILLRVLGKKIYLWRNHYMGSLRTRVAVLFSTKVFCTSRYSYTARFKKTVLMPVGVNVISQNVIDDKIMRMPGSILFLGRLDESKRPLLLVEALGVLKQKGREFKAVFVGAPSDPQSTYPKQVVERASALGITEACEFVGAVKSTETWRYYQQCEVFVNCSRSGMFDKTMFEAAANGCLVVSSSLDLSQLMDGKLSYKENDFADLAFVLMQALAMNTVDRKAYFDQLYRVLETNSLTALSVRLKEELV